MKPYRIIELVAILIVLGLMFMARPKPVNYNYQDRFQQNESAGGGEIYFIETEDGKLGIHIEGYTGMTEAAQEFIGALDGCACE